MHGLEISAVYDLGASSKRARLRESLLAKLHDEKTSSYGFDYAGARVHPIMGDLVRVDFSRYGAATSMDMLVPFEGLRVKLVQIKEGGSDHFPQAGCYESWNLESGRIDGASATVRWAIEHDYPLSEDTIEAIVRNAGAHSYPGDTIRLEVPVVIKRSWSLVLTAPTFKKALEAHTLLRSGTWQPAMPFMDVLPEAQKVRLLQQMVAEED